MEYESKKEKQKLPRSSVSYHLKRQQENPEKELTGYEPAEQEKKKEHFPKERLLAETEDGVVSGGFYREKEKNQKMVLMVSMVNDDKALQEEKRLYKDRAREQKVRGKTVLTNSPKPKKSAAFLEMDAAKSKERLLSQLEASVEKTGSETMSSLFPYLKGKELTEQIHALEEEAREHSQEVELVREKRLQAAYLREDMQKQEQERRRLLQLLENRLEKPREKKRRFIWEPMEQINTEPEAEDSKAGETPPEDKPETKKEKREQAKTWEMGPAEKSVFDV